MRASREEARRKTSRPGAGPAGEAGCRANLCGAEGADRRREEDGEQGSILSELGSHPRGHGTELARRERGRRMKSSSISLH